MVTEQNTDVTSIEETTNLIQEYHQLISRALEKELDDEEHVHILLLRRLIEARKRAQETSDKIIARAQDESNAIISQARESTLRIIHEAETRTSTHEEEILCRARAKADSLVTDAERLIRVNAENNMRSEIARIAREAQHEADSVISAARREASRLVNESKQDAESAAMKTIAKANNEAVQIISEAREAAKREAENESLATMAEARSRAEKVIAEAEEQGKVAAQMLTSVRDEAQAEAMRIIGNTQKLARELIGAVRAVIKKELDESILLISEQQQRLDRVADQADERVASSVSETLVPGLSGDLDERVSGS